jgi:hypothetical protein
MTDYNLKGLSVFLAMPVQEDVPIETVVSLFATDAHFRNLGVPLHTTFQIGGTLCGSRCQAAADFLASGANRLLCLDSDMVWKPEDVVRLLAMSTVMDIVTAPYVARRDPPAFFVRVPNGEDLTCNEHGCVAIDGTGLGFCVISRKVIEDLSTKAPTIQFPASVPIPELFRFTVVDGQFRGEDIAFFEDARAAGYQCWMDTSIQLGHVGRKVYSAKLNLREA